MAAMTEEERKKKSLEQAALSNNYNDTQPTWQENRDRNIADIAARQPVDDIGNKTLYDLNGQQNVMSYSNHPENDFNRLNYGPAQKPYIEKKPLPYNSFNEPGIDPGDRKVIDYKKVTPNAQPSIQLQSGRQVQSQPQQPQQPSKFYNGNNPVEIAREAAGWYTNGSGYREQPAGQNKVTPETQLQNAAPFIKSMAGYGLENQAKQQQPSNQSVQIVGNGSVRNQSFDGNGNSRMYDMAGNEMTRADQEQSKLMASMQRLVDLATPAYSISHPNPSAEAARALQVAGGLKAVGTIPDVQKDMATARHMNVTSDLAPGMANATNAAHYASANASNANANKAGLESQYYPKIANSEIGVKNAQAYALRNPKNSHNYDLEMREKAAGIASKLSELSPENFQSNYDNVINTIYGETKKKKGLTVKDAMRMLPK